MSLEPTAPRPAPAFTADEERPITGRPFLVPLYVPHFTARSLPARMLALFTGVRGRLILGSLVRLDAPVAEEDYVTMYVILWRFRPMVGQESEFERAYGPSGEWAQLFRRDHDYLGTELLRCSDDESGEYLTLDRWASRAAYEAFRARWIEEYRRLDRRLEELTELESFQGAFEVLP